jgi:hypothetical protein
MGKRAKISNPSGHQMSISQSWQKTAGVDTEHKINVHYGSGNVIKTGKEIRDMKTLIHM